MSTCFLSLPCTHARPIPWWCVVRADKQATSIWPPPVGHYTHYTLACANLSRHQLKRTFPVMLFPPPNPSLKLIPALGLRRGGSTMGQ